MKLFTSLLLFSAIIYYLFQFVRFLKKRKEKMLIPGTKEERAAIRKDPQSKKPHQKENLMPYTLILTLIIVLYGLGIAFSNDRWSFNLMLLLLLINSSNLLNGFAIVEDGLLSGGRFIPWRKIREFNFVPIDLNHKYYGYSQEVNQGYELKIKGRWITETCIVTTEEMKVKLTNILSDHVELSGGKLKEEVE